MITILSQRHAALVFRYLRERQRISRRDLAARLFVSEKTVGNRERHVLGMATDATIDTAHALGYRLALVPHPHPGARPTGTGWPEVTPQ
jgi:DNA-binding XRE family transcriptional regulator